MACVIARGHRDYYAVLGVPRHADARAIKKAFRRLASELHPDVSPDPGAEARFREVAEAYRVLSRPESRQRYDRLGHGTRGAAGGGSDFRLFDDLVRTAAAARPRRGERGADVAVTASIGFVEALRGTTRRVAVRAAETCSDCRGGGARRGSLGGTCSRCGGAGRVGAERTVVVRIPPGAKDGERVVLRGAGHVGGPGGPSGDVVVEVRVEGPEDLPGLRRAAAAGAVVAALLLVVVALVVLH